MKLSQVQAEIAAAPLTSPYPLDIAIAIVNDCFRFAGKPPVDDDTWIRWACDQHALWAEQLGVIAHFLASTSLRAVTLDALRAGRDRRDTLPAFFDTIAPLTAEMLRSNAFRQEEMLRRWADWCGVPIDGESPRRSAERLEQLDYRKTLAEYKKAEAARKAEEARRAQLLREAQEREAAARGWRE